MSNPAIARKRLPGALALSELMELADAMGAYSTQFSQICREEMITDGPPTVTTTISMNITWYLAERAGTSSDDETVSDDCHPPGSRPASPDPSVISIDSTVSDMATDAYPESFDNQFNTLDTSGLSPSTVAAADTSPSPGSIKEAIDLLDNLSATATTVVGGSSPVNPVSLPATAASPVVSAPTTVAAPAISAVEIVNTTYDRIYCVTVGRKVGVFQGWHLAARYVVGVSGATYTRYKTFAAAQNAFDAATAAGSVHIVT